MLASFKVRLCVIVLSVVCTVEYNMFVYFVARVEIFMDFVSFLSTIIYGVLYTLS